jgi:hypothetical protein
MQTEPFDFILILNTHGTIEHCFDKNGTLKENFILPNKHCDFNDDPENPEECRVTLLSAVQIGRLAYSTEHFVEYCQRAISCRQDIETIQRRLRAYRDLVTRKDVRFHKALKETLKEDRRDEIRHKAWNIMSDHFLDKVYNFDAEFSFEQNIGMLTLDSTIPPFDLNVLRGRGGRNMRNPIDIWVARSDLINALKRHGYKNILLIDHACNPISNNRRLTRVARRRVGQSTMAGGTNF